MLVLEEIDLDGHVDAKGIRYIGKATRQMNGKYLCLANVGGALCRVEITLTLLDRSEPEMESIKTVPIQCAAIDNDVIK